MSQIAIIAAPTSTLVHAAKLRGYDVIFTQAIPVRGSYGLRHQLVNGNPASYISVEGSLSYLLAKGLTGIINGSYNKARDDVTGLWLASAPNYTASLGAISRWVPR